MTPEEFFHSIVVPNLMEFEAKKYRMREAFNAFTAAHHLPDHLFRFKTPQGSKRELAAFRVTLALKCPETELVSDVANSFKHLILTQPDRKVQSLDQLGVTGQRVTEDGATRVTEDGSMRLVEEAEVVIELDDGSSASAFETVQKLVAFWSGEYFM